MASKGSSSVVLATVPRVIRPGPLGVRLDMERRESSTASASTNQTAR